LITFTCTADALGAASAHITGGTEAGGGVVGGSVTGGSVVLATVVVLATTDVDVLVPPLEVDELHPAASVPVSTATVATTTPEMRTRCWDEGEGL
jgi:hypothetical protein